MIAIHPQYLSLSKLLDGRLFRIPEYQRAYSWTSHERGDLFSDIKRLYSKDADEGHFMAAVVALRREKLTLGTDEFHVVEVVDGQQRLTTLIILLNSIKLALRQDDRREARLAQELGELLVKPDGDELLLLQTNHDSSHHFANYLRHGTASSSTVAKTISDREILKAIEDCENFVREWKNASLPELVALLKNRIFFLLHEIEDEKAVYTVFEVLNSRGLEVSWLDRVKSILMGSAFELKAANKAGIIKELHNVWRDIYSTIGLRQGLSTEALRFAATLKVSESPNRPLSEQDAADTLRSLATNASKIREVASWQLRVTRACDKVVANPRVNAVTRISQARLLATALYLREDLKEEQRANLLHHWEKVSFRIYGMLDNDARKRVGDYVRLAWRVINENLSAKAIDQAIGAIGNGDEFSIDRAVANLKEENCYENWETELRYFMFRYEEYLAKKQNQKFQNEQWEKIWMVSPAESIEHVWPQSKAPEKHRHRLGNLVLLPPKLNSQLQNSAPIDKVEAYRKTGLLIAGEVAEAIEERGWNRQTIEEREGKLLEWAAKEWAE